MQIATYARIADIAKTRLDDLTLSRDYYLKVIEERPDDATALDALEEIFTTTRDPEGLLDILRRKTDLATNADTRVRLLLRQAEISETQTRDVNAAIEAYEQVLSDADPIDAYRGLERLYPKTERYQDLAALYERQIEKRVGDMVEAHYALGKLSAERLQDSSQALHHFREAVSKHSNHAASIVALEAMMVSGEHRAEAAEILEPVYLARLDWQKVIASLEARITPDSDPDVRKKLLARLAEYHEVQLEDIDAAVETYARVFREEPTDETTWDVLTRLTRTNSKWGRLAEIYGETLATIDTDEPATARLAMITGRLHDEKTGDLVKAAEFYHRALRFDPTDRAAFDAVESVYLRQNSQDALLALYREQADIAPDDATRLRLLHKLAAIHNEVRNDADAAIDAYREVLDAAPNDATALRVLDARYAELGRHQDLADHLRHRIDLGPVGGDDIELKARLGDLLATHLNDKSSAIDLYEEILAKNHTHHSTIVALETLIRDEEYRMRIIQLLEPIYRKAGQWKKLVAIFEAQIPLVDDSMERSRILGEIGELYEQKGRDGDMAFAAWARALAEDPGSEKARAELDRLAALLGMWDAQVAAYEDAITHTQDEILIGQFLRAIAKTHDEHRGDPRGAIQTYERLLAHDDQDNAPFDALEGLHTMVGDWLGLVDVLNRRVERSYDAVERGEFLRRMGSVREELIGDRDGAVAAFRRALDENDTDELALEALDRLYSQGEEWELLADVLRRRAELTQEPELRAELGMRLGELFEQKLRQGADAIPVFERVLDDKPNDKTAVSALSRLYEAQGMWPELLDNLRLRAGMSENPSEKVTLLARIGEVLEKETNDVNDALSAYRDVLDIDRAHAPTLDALLRITKLDEYRATAAEILEPRLRELGRYDDLAQLLESTAEGISDPITKHAELRRIAALHEEQRSDAKAAFETLRRAFAEDPADQATSTDLERLAESLNGWDTLSETLSARASTVLDPNDGKRIYMRLAWILEEKLGNDAQAIEAYRRAAELTGDEDDVLAALERLYEKTHQWNDLSETLDRRLAAASDPAQSTELLLRLGQLRESQFHDPRGAFEAYREVLDRSPRKGVRPMHSSG
ncbi:MAG: hypothetical protein IPK60_19850 [Sandaracinaceae bacterium]|nr:hypothetical protein [Sandaracinaceae bacterium]